MRTYPTKEMRIYAMYETQGRLRRIIHDLELQIIKLDEQIMQVKKED